MSADIWETIRQHLINDQSVSSFVDNRIFCTVGPKNEKRPHIVYTEVSANNFTRAIPCDTNIVRMRMQFDCYSQSSFEAKTISDKLVASLNRNQALAPIEDIYVLTSFFDYDEPTLFFRSSVDFEIVYNNLIVR